MFDDKTMIPSYPTTSTYATTYISEGTGVQNVQPTIELGILSDGLILSKVVIGPCGILLLATSFLLAYIVIKHLSFHLRLYFSLLIYTFFQVFLLLVIFVSPVIQGYTSNYCQSLSVTEHLATILPGYGVLMVTAARWTCASYPLRYKKLLDLRMQVVVVGTVVCVMWLVTCLPLMGVCQFSWRVNVRLWSGGYCVIGQEIGTYNTLPSGTSLNTSLTTSLNPDFGALSRTESGRCVIFRCVLVGAGYVLPTVGVLLLYFLIIRVLVRHNEKKLGKCQRTSTTSNINNSSKPVPVPEKLALLRVIGQESIPWSVIVILTLNTLSSLLWIPHIFLQDLYYNSKLSAYLAVDIVNCAMLLTVSCSPLAYMLTTPPMRVVLSRLTKRSKRTFSNGNMHCTKT